MMMGGRVILEAPVVDVELAALKRRVGELEEHVRTLTAANLALVRAMEAMREEVRRILTGPPGTTAEQAAEPVAAR
ncbi:hypothetical protein E1286_35235 [Nonomuraea terrae]|uniref:SlyX family protein n=1 Tax=Nonomuraea terrae TaxID=2530383 RepID=A0A4R4Y909_9ACTN|nr:hypothetical protein [Nonomuraea terrae]TDD39542.1 hypothetical protein E1286_35235 [Nonomuraea terrae]